jgi:hypothetical protein
MFRARPPQGQGATPEEKAASQASREQLTHLTSIEPQCHGVEVAEGILLRYLGEEPLYFFLKTSIVLGEIVTRIYSSDTPFEREQEFIRELRSPAGNPGADQAHLAKIEQVLHDYVIFVGDADEGSDPFTPTPTAPKKPG